MFKITVEQRYLVVFHDKSNKKCYSSPYCYNKVIDSLVIACSHFIATKLNVFDKRIQNHAFKMRSFVGSDFRSKTKGSRFESGC